MEAQDKLIACSIYRGSRQADLYLYLRSDLEPKSLPQALLQRLGALTLVMRMELTPARKLARVDVRKVITLLESQGWYVQFPPDGQIRAHLYFGD